MIATILRPPTTDVAPTKKSATARPPKRRLPQTVYYPETDGEPMADSDPQYDAMVDGKYSLVNYYKNDPQVYIAANMFIYYVKGDNTKHIAPDIFVVHGVTNRKRSSYKTWQEGRMPSIVFEIASPGTYQKDILKKTRYLDLRIAEYIMLDPYNGDLFDDALQGFRLTLTEQGKYRYEPIAKLVGDNQELIAGLYSEELGLEIWAKQGPANDAPAIFRFRNPETGEWLLSQKEGEADRLAAHQRAEHEAQRAEQEAQRAEHEAQRAEQERQAHFAVEAENARLRALLEQLNSPKPE